MKILKGQNVLVMGLGLFGGGVGVARYLLQRGAKVTVTDLRSGDDLLESLGALEGYPIHFKLGGHDEEDFLRSDLIVANPAVPRFSPFLQVAESAGVPITTEICLFIEECPAPVVGVTGSSGKTTTTSLLGEMFMRLNDGTVVGGNIGGSLLGRLGNITAETPVILELSSFQLDRLGDLSWSPNVAVITNFLPNHLDVHGSLEAYRNAKYQIVANQGLGDTAILNHDDVEVSSWMDSGAEKCVTFSLQERLEEGVFIESGKISHTMKGKKRTVCSSSILRLPGRHNLANALAATTGALLCGISEKQISNVLSCFPGVEHRLEKVAKIKGVTYYNDSISTSPDRTRVALEAFSDPVILIAGGSDKGLNYHGLGITIGRKVSHLVLLGKTADAIASAIPEGVSPLIHHVTCLEDAVFKASDLSCCGDMVLFSPASASYDMFRNFEERGHLFKKLINAKKERNI